MRNIELFDEYTAKIMAVLYERFPNKRALDVREICGHTAMNDFGLVVDDNGNPSGAFDVAMGTLEWLGDNGYVRYNKNSGYGWTDVVLTEKGLAMLNKVPNSVASKETFGDRLSRFVREGAMGLAKEATKAAFAAVAEKLI